MKKTTIALCALLLAAAMLFACVPMTALADDTQEPQSAFTDVTSFFAYLEQTLGDEQTMALIEYLRGGGSFLTWVEENVAPPALIPAEVFEMSHYELIKYLADILVGYISGRRHVNTTEAGAYVFTPTTAAQPTGGATERATGDLPSRADAEPTTAGQPSHGERPRVGDVNGDGQITAGDARRILRAAADLEVLSDAQRYAADVNGDGRVTSRDARAVLRFSADLIGTL